MRTSDTTKIIPKIMGKIYVENLIIKSSIQLSFKILNEIFKKKEYYESIKFCK